DSRGAHGIHGPTDGVRRRQVPTRYERLCDAAAMVLRRFLGVDHANGPATPLESETDTVRRIVRELEQLEPEQRRYLAGFAYITAEEFAELTEIAQELDLPKDELNDLRRQYADKSAAVRAVRGQPTS